MIVYLQNQNNNFIEWPNLSWLKTTKRKTDLQTGLQYFHWSDASLRRYECVDCCRLIRQILMKHRALEATKHETVNTSLVRAKGRAAFIFIY